jgi:hypothetical protein
MTRPISQVERAINAPPKPYRRFQAAGGIGNSIGDDVLN